MVILVKNVFSLLSSLLQTCIQTRDLINVMNPFFQTFEISLKHCNYF